MPRRQDISEDLREANDAAHQSGQGYKAFSRLFEIHYRPVRDGLQMEGLQEAANLFQVNR